MASSSATAPISAPRPWPSEATSSNRPTCPATAPSSPSCWPVTGTPTSRSVAVRRGHRPPLVRRCRGHLQRHGPAAGQSLRERRRHPDPACGQRRRQGDLRPARGVKDISAGYTQWEEDWTASFQDDGFATMLCPPWMMGPLSGNADGVEGWDIADVFPGGGGNWGGSYISVTSQDRKSVV